MTQNTFQALGLADVLLSALSAMDISIPTPIQAQAIKPVMTGRDVLGIAQTGTGKTAAFSLPIIHQLLETPARPKSGSARVLVLAPTRELALQIAENVKGFTAGTPIRHMTVFGGVSIRPQIETAKRGVDIVIATPGRLLDLIEQRALTLADIQHLVLDEADRMLDMGFIRDINRIVKMVPEKRQSLLFSATMPQNIASLAAKILKDPVRVEVTPEVVTVEKIDQSVFLVPQKAKKHWLIKHLPGFDKTVVFTRTKHGANRLAEDLGKAGIEALAIHGNKSQGARQKALGEFHSGKLRVLVATDIVARGIHVDDITHVVNFDLPEEPESYVHRIGRTARAGKSGVAMTLCDPSEKPKLRQVEKLTGLRFDVQTTEFTDASGFADEPAREPRGPRQGRGGRPGGGGAGRSDGGRHAPRGGKPGERRGKPAGGGSGAPAREEQRSGRPGGARRGGHGGGGRSRQANS
ncbi:DEAD/DEAH box helicase [Aureimonas jatrophae]|uniref:ATP-dependent RNA helicase RhlE n=1 Tax=Aureimonas jatrophae TaxID=1166073 RepID=A0A1H0BVG5_9HYPH|nr:DEAD/DEAH box helicase [Aureimonas jatrophae]MBB3948948.1 ATP-dependent RNA helicase RhlE [Aureimonas jatrophae]SDN49587.1 ATP-dependent RNA helicase RhlE [Aureimonas jatrophae]